MTDADPGTAVTILPSEAVVPVAAPLEPAADLADLVIPVSFIPPQEPAPAPAAVVPPAAPPPASTGEARWLQESELLDRVALNSGDLIQELKGVALHQLTAEEARQTRLDAKAQGLAQTAGLSLTVAFTFGGLLVQHPDKIGAGWTPILLVIVPLYALAMIFGLLASHKAVKALRISSTLCDLNERAVFKQTVLDNADELEHAAKGSGVSRYVRFALVHYWQVYQERSDANTKRAKEVDAGQRHYERFLRTLLVLALVLGIAAATTGVVRLLDQSETTPVASVDGGPATDASSYDALIN